ncbi:hypothetical protein [Spirosoma spitsbergense]|uniref:hypothetical protein n=1 Tax=Spirosoma spitsbergense TaxID=431554 RepID=UPI000381B271|nr:hypothetical protein [Spirosoma spitsbergense]
MKTLSAALLFLCLSHSIIQAQQCISGDCNNGFGRLYWQAQDQTYEGSFVGGKRQGQGKCTFGPRALRGSGIDSYDGRWQNDGFVSGKIAFVDGRVYNGPWAEQPHGANGTMVYQDGTKYSGSWEKGKRHGFGCITDEATKKKMCGAWVNDVPGQLKASIDN